jgi:hypothetical protein
MFKFLTIVAACVLAGLAFANDNAGAGCILTAIAGGLVLFLPAGGDDEDLRSNAEVAGWNRPRR